MFHALAGRPDAALIKGVSEGLTLIAAHVTDLQDSIATLAAAKQPAGIAAVSAPTDEEAAKYLILVDAIRCDPKDRKTLSSQLKRACQHLAKGIYAEVTGMSPADLNEVRRISSGMRQSHYLDGPMDVDWIFRNDLIERREGSLYVDYVVSDDDAWWHAPNADRMFLHGDPTPVVRLVASMTRAGVASEDGLRVVAGVWRGFVPEGETHWQEIRSRNSRTLRSLEERGLVSEDFSERDARIFVNEWTFPLHHEDLSMIQINLDELRDKQARWTPG